MATANRGLLGLVTFSRASLSTPPRRAFQRFSTPSRSYSELAATSNANPDQPHIPLNSATSTEAENGQKYRIQAGIILTRAPLLTKEPTDFESAYYFYQKRLNERLVLPFRSKAFFKHDTPPQLDWAIKLRERNGIVAREVGPFNGKSAMAWNDELKVGDKLSSQEALTESLLRDAEQRVSDDAEEIPVDEIVPVERPYPRRTEADLKGDVRRLDRALDRTLYLVVKTQKGAWEFPATSLGTEERLHEAARRVMDSAAGVNMNTWVVGRVPVAHLVYEPVVKEDGSLARRGKKVFFLKARVMAGQADITNNPFGLVDFKWLTRDELKDELAPEYFKGVRNMMADR